MAAQLEALQIRILERIECLEASLGCRNVSRHSAPAGDPPHPSKSLAHNPEEEEEEEEEDGGGGGGGGGGDSSLEHKLSRILESVGVDSFVFKRVPSDYYDRSFEERRDLLGAASIDHLCKSIVMVNTQAHESVTDCSDYHNSKFYLVIIQYTARLNAEKVKQFVYSLNNGRIAKKRFNLRLAPEDEAYRLTGFKHNAVTPVGMKTRLPIILSDAIVKLEPQFFWLGGGEVDLKLGMDTQQFIDSFKPFITDCS